MDIAILDYGTGNLHSLAKALELGGARVRVDRDPVTACAADGLVLPGVGAFADAAAQLRPYREVLRDALGHGLPCLGICLGMQMLLDHSEEGPGSGIGAAGGGVHLLPTSCVPHMGWNSVHASPAADQQLLDGVDGEHFYFANSYFARPTEPATVAAWTEYEEVRLPALLAIGKTFGVQFHPEKSGPAGLRVIANFLRSVSR